MSNVNGVVFREIGPECRWRFIASELYFFFFIIIIFFTWLAAYPNDIDAFNLELTICILEWRFLK